MLLNGPRPHSSRDLWRLEGRMAAFERPGCAAGRRRKKLVQVPSGSKRRPSPARTAPSDPHLWLNAADTYLKSYRRPDA